MLRLIQALRNKLKQRRAIDVLEMALPSRPQVRAHQKQAALHVQLAQEIGWKGPRR